MNCSAWKSSMPNRSRQTCGTTLRTPCGSRGRPRPHRPARIEVRQKSFPSGVEGQAQADQGRVRRSPTRWTSSTRCGTTCRSATAEEGPEGAAAEKPRGTPGAAAGARRCLAGRHPSHAGLGHGRRATLSAVAGAGGQPNGRSGVGPSTGAGASARRVAVGGRPSGRPATGDGRPAPPRRDRGGVRRAATRPCCRTWSGPASSVLSWSGSNTWTSFSDEHGQAHGRAGRTAVRAGRARDGAGAGGQLLRGGGRVLPPEALAAGAGRHADQGRVRQVSERAVVRGRDGPVRRAAGAGRLRRPGRPPGDDDRRGARKKRTRGGCRPCR